MSCRLRRAAWSRPAWGNWEKDWDLEDDMTINLTRNFGASFRVMPDANGRRYLTIVVWYLKAKRQLGYMYPSIPLGL